jgi:hypothetical protein
MANFCSVEKGQEVIVNGRKKPKKGGGFYVKGEQVLEGFRRKLSSSSLETPFR